MHGPCALHVRTHVTNLGISSWFDAMKSRLCVLANDCRLFVPKALRLFLIPARDILGMKEYLEKIHVENFKSLRNFDIELGKFNVLVGPNGSGKTNVLELFKFISLCVSPDRNPPHPFSPWQGFNNIVWSGKEELLILFSLQYSMHDPCLSHLGSATKDLHSVDLTL